MQVHAAAWENGNHNTLWPCFHPCKVPIASLGHGEYIVKSVCARGRGAYGTVYLVQHATSFKQFAAKIETVTHTLIDEISILQGLDHPAFLKVIQSFTVHGGLSWFVMPYLPHSLFSWLHSGQKLDGVGQCAMFAQLVDGLAYLHSKDVIHADLKPGNILFSPYDLSFYIIDFGIAIRLPVSEGKKPVAWLH